MNQFTTIGVSGRARSGKDSIYSIISNHFGADRVAKVAFADELKREAAEFLATNNPQSARTKFQEWTGLSNDQILDIFGDVYEASEEFGYDGTEVDWHFNRHQDYDDQVAWIISLFNTDRPEVKQRFRKLLQYWGTEYRRKQDDQYWLKAWQKRAESLPDTIDIVCVPDCRFPNEYDFLLNNGALVFRVERPALGAANDLHPSETALDGVDYWDAYFVNETLDQLKVDVEDALYLHGVVDAVGEAA